MSAVMALSLLSTIALTNCSGSSNSTTPLPSASKSPVVAPINPNSRGSLTVTVVIPKNGTAPTAVHHTKAVRKPSYVTSAVNSIVFTQTTSSGTVLGTPNINIMTIGGAGCVTNSGAQTCTTVLTAPIGQDEWTVQTYAAADGSGSALSFGILATTILAGTGNVASLTLNPVVASLAFVPISGSANTSPASTTSVVLNALDATGATIIGSTPFVDRDGNLLTIHLAPDSVLSAQKADGSVATAIITNASENDLAKIAYDGTAMAGTANFTAWAPNISSAVFPLTLTAGSLTDPSGGQINIGANGTSGTISISEVGYAGTFTATPNPACTGVINVGAASGTGPSASFPLTQIGAGTCTVVITDNHGGSITDTIVSTTFIATIN